MSGRHRKEPPPRPSRHGRHRKPAQHQRVLVPVVTVAAVLAGGGVAVGLVESAGNHQAVTSSTSTPPPGPAVPAAPLRPSTAAAAPSAPARATARPRPSRRSSGRQRKPPPRLELRVVGSASYFQVRSGDRVLVQRIYQHGQHLDLARPGLSVVIGNAGAVRLSVRGHAGRIAGRPGQVRDLTVR
jgi:hypothetical protein